MLYIYFSCLLCHFLYLQVVFLLLPLSKYRFLFRNCGFTGWRRKTVLLALRKKLNKKGYFSFLCKQLAASHACTINGHLIGNNHFYLSKFKIGSCPQNKQLLVEPSGNIVWMLEDVADQCLQEVVHTSTLAYPTAGTHLQMHFYPNPLRALEDLCMQPTGALIHESNCIALNYCHIC